MVIQVSNVVTLRSMDEQSVTLYVRVDGRVARVDIAGVMGVLDGAVVRMVQLVAVERRTGTFVCDFRMRACGASGVRRGAWSGA